MIEGFGLRSSESESFDHDQSRITTTTTCLPLGQHVVRAEVGTTPLHVDVVLLAWHSPQMGSSPQMEVEGCPLHHTSSSPPDHVDVSSTLVHPMWMSPPQTRCCSSPRPDPVLQFSTVSPHPPQIPCCSSSPPRPELRRAIPCRPRVSPRQPTVLAASLLAAGLRSTLRTEPCCSSRRSPNPSSTTGWRTARAVRGSGSPRSGSSYTTG